MVQDFCNPCHGEWSTGKNGGGDHGYIRYEGADGLPGSQAVKLDAFTGLYNKEHTIKLITENLRRESHMKHALIILDIDNFKNFNDTFGHFEGDKVIKAVAEKIQNTFRKTDIAGRFGGD